MVWQLADGQVDGLRLSSAVLGLATSVILIVTGREYRRRLPPEDVGRDTWCPDVRRLEHREGPAGRNGAYPHRTPPESASR